ncbi:MULTISPECIES: hypothetical protein [unclassified Spiroplasma]|uniref:hypothetical protein n=1 Tax=unclassified Spiroplasma TaxID=2637901 RepID=UPI00313CC130
MKKLLGILGTITIAGSGMTGIVGNAPRKIEQSFMKREKRATSPYLVEANNDIIVKYDYYYGRTGDASWSYTLRFNDKKTLNIVDFTKYASDWNSFIEKYPYIIINTYGEENSPETFGNVGKDKFGDIKINLNNVDINHNNSSDKAYWRTLVKANQYWFASYDVDCDIEIGLWIENNKELKLNIYVYSYLYSAGATNRHLTTVLGINFAKIVNN